MTELYIDGQLAALPEGFNITFTSENPYFTRSSNYSLDIELPMPANHAIFKHVNRLDHGIRLPLRLDKRLASLGCSHLWSQRALISETKCHRKKK